MDLDSLVNLLVFLTSVLMTFVKDSKIYIIGRFYVGKIIFPNINELKASISR